MSSPKPNAGTIASREIELRATPEQVWQAIATGAGHAGWLFPAEIEERVSGSMVIHRAPFGGDATATVTAYEPLRRFAFEAQVGADKPWATELLVEGRSGGVTVVRVVTGFYDGGEGWEPMVEGAAEGWSGSLAHLRVYVEHFLGQAVTGVGVTADTGRPLEERSLLAAELLGALNLIGHKAGDRVAGPDDAPPFGGVLEVDPATGPLTADTFGCLVRTDVPGPGIFEVSTFSMNGQTVTVNVVGRLYGDGGAAIANREETAGSPGSGSDFLPGTRSLGHVEFEEMQEKRTTTMTFQSPTDATSAISAAAARLAIVAATTSVLLLAGLHVLSPEYDPSWRVISEYAGGAYPSVLSLMFVAVAISAWSLAFAIRSQLTTTPGKIGVALLGVAGVGAAMASIFDVNHSLHIVAGLLGIVGFPIAAVLISNRLRRDPQWAPARRPIRWTANLTWLSIVLFAGAMVIMTVTYLATGAPMTGEVPAKLPEGVIALPGWVNRLTIVANSLWVGTVAWQALQVTRGETRRLAPQPAAA